MTTGRNSEKSRYFVFIVITAILSLTLALAAGEIMMRIVYCDGGTTTSGGPGGKRFIYTTDTDGMRGPHAEGPKRPGIKRILVQGDSLTFGQGVKDWKKLYPYLLLQKLNEHGEKYEMETIGQIDREIDGHTKALELVVDKLKPDIILYQWYVNDIELRKNRPESRLTVWRDLPFHKWLKDRSYLYFFLDNRLSILLPSFNRSYDEYLLEDFAEGTNNWAAFREMFHRWATLATSQAERTIILLYPALPFSGDKYPLSDIHDRMRKICGPNVMSYQVSYLPKIVGENVKDETSRYGVVRKAQAGKTAPDTLVFGPYIPLAKGDYTVTFRMKTSALTPDPLAIVDVVAAKGSVTLAKKEVKGEDFGQAGQWRDFKLSFTVGEKRIDQVEFRVRYAGAADLYVDTIDLPVDYGIEVVDPTPQLKDFNTHASMFDAHPNARAHAVMADAFYKQIMTGGKKQIASR